MYYSSWWAYYGFNGLFGRHPKEEKKMPDYPLSKTFWKKLTPVQRVVIHTLFDGRNPHYALDMLEMAEGASTEDALQLRGGHLDDLEAFLGTCPDASAQDVVEALCKPCPFPLQKR